MKIKTKTYVRYTIQILFFLVFIILFFLINYPKHYNFPLDIFLQIDPLIAITVSIAGRVLLNSLIFAIIFLILTLIFGRIFCGWICPFGTFIDFTGLLLKGKRERKPIYNNIKYIILIMILVSALFSFQFLLFADPIVILTRTMISGIFPFLSVVLRSLGNILYKIPFLRGLALGMFNSLATTLLPDEPPNLRLGFLITSFTIIILSLELARKRFWCRNLCALGGLLALTSRFSLLQRKVSDECNQCGLCQKQCKMGAIPSNPKNIITSECILCLNCDDICPQNAISFTFAGISNTQKENKFDLSRRQFIGASTLAIIGAALVPIDYKHKLNKRYLLRPPGALPEDEFLIHCISCGECMKACSSIGRVIQPALFESGLEGFWTPIMIPRKGYCEYNCKLCGEVCPTGAIQKLTLEEKQKVRIGLAYFNRNRCIPWYRGEDCLVCEEHCPLPEKAIYVKEVEVISISGEKHIIKRPYIDESLCIGCGICESVCPMEGEAAIRIFPPRSEDVSGY